MRIAGIVRDSIVNGEGIRDVVFFQGCNKQCEGCHNPDTWDYEGGCVRNSEVVAEELAGSSNDVTISGGEPLDQFLDLAVLCDRIKKQGKSIWLYTGYTVQPTKHIYKLLSEYVDVVVDGRYVEEFKDPNLLFRGSSNQRIIDLPKSVKEGKIILWEEC